MIDKQVLGGIIADPEVLNDVIDFVEPKWFQEPMDKVWNLMVDLHSDNLPIDTTSLYEESLKRGYNLQPILFSALAEDMITGSKVSYYSKLLKERYLAQETSKIIGDTKNKLDAGEDVFEILDDHTQRVMDLTTEKQDGGEDISLSVKRVVSHLERIKSGDHEGLWVDSGYYDLDRKVKLMNKELTYVAGRPSMGKTALMLNMVSNIARNEHVGVFSLEMGHDQLTTRLITSEIGDEEVSYMDMLTGSVANDKGRDIALAANDVAKLKLFVDDSPGLTPLQLATKAKRMKKKYDIKILFVDYIGLMQYQPLHQQREREMSYISGKLKALAKDLNIPVVALSQLSRGVESRVDKRPQLSDLRDSGSLEQDADTVIFLYRPEYYGEATLDDGSPSDGICQLLVRKNRNGGVGDINLKFRKQIMKFENIYPL